MNGKESKIPKTSEELITIIKKGERVHCPPSWVWKSAIALSLGSFILFACGMAVSFRSITSENHMLILVCAIVSALFAFFGLYKLNERAFSIRLNAFGIMITNYSRQKWYSWKDVCDIRTNIHHGHNITSMSAAIEISKDTYSKIITLPENYEISAHALVKEMLEYKHQFDELELYKFPELEALAQEVAPLNLINILWGREGAKKKP